jgi:hypothetical protein
LLLALGISCGDRTFDPPSAKDIGKGGRSLLGERTVGALGEFGIDCDGDVEEITFDDGFGRSKLPVLMSDA